MGLEVFAKLVGGEGEIADEIMKYKIFFSLIICNLNNCKCRDSPLISVYKFIYKFIQVIANVSLNPHDMQYDRVVGSRV